jgi:hypothetical protein
LYALVLVGREFYAPLDAVEYPTEQFFASFPEAVALE